MIPTRRTLNHGWRNKLQGREGECPSRFRCKEARIGLWPPTFQWLHSLWSDWNSVKLTNLSDGQHTAYRYCRPYSFQTHYGHSMHGLNWRAKRHVPPISRGRGQTGIEALRGGSCKTFSPSQFSIACSTPALNMPRGPKNAPWNLLPNFGGNFVKSKPNSKMFWPLYKLSCTVYCNRPCLCVCVFVGPPYYIQRAVFASPLRAFCVSLSLYVENVVTHGEWSTTAI